MENPIEQAGTVVKGYQVASGLAVDSPYPKGTIELQVPLFKELGLDLSDFYWATLNINIEPYHIKLVNADFHFKQLLWVDKSRAEDFSFVEAKLNFAGQGYSGYWYYPHPETKPCHQHSDQLVEFIGPKVVNLGYGSQVKLEFDARKVEIRKF